MTRDPYIWLLTENYRALIERDLGDEEKAKDIFDKSINNVFENIKSLGCIDYENLLTVEIDIPNTDKNYHGLELLGHLEFNAAQLETDDSIRRERLQKAVKLRELTLSTCPEHINNMPATYEYIYTYSKLVADMIENNPEEDMGLLLEGYRTMLDLEKRIICVPYFYKKRDFVDSTSNLYNEKIRPMYEKVKTKIKELGGARGDVYLKDICDSAEEMGFQPNTVQAFLKKMAMFGEYFSNKLGYIQLINDPSGVDDTSTISKIQI